MPEDTAPLDTTIEPPKLEIPAHREDIQAPYVFTPDETAEMNVQMRTALDEIEDLQGQAKAAAQDFKLRITNEQNTVKRLRQKLGAGEESRPMKAAVDFDPKRRMKRYLDPETGVFIREVPMQPADWQLEMFKKEASAEPVSPASGSEAQEGAEHPEPAPGTNLGNALDAAAAKTDAPQIVLDLTKEDWTPKGLLAAFRKAAKLAGWSEPQIATLADQVKATQDVDAMMDTLRPHTVAGVVKPNAGDTITIPLNHGNDPVEVPLLALTFEPGFPAEKYVAQFRAAASKAGWPAQAADTVANEAERIARVVENEPEAGIQVAKYLNTFTI